MPSYTQNLGLYTPVLTDEFGGDFLPGLTDNFKIIDQQFSEVSASYAYVNVKDYGAKGDGVTNDSEAFQAALGTGSRHVFVPEGTYRVNGVEIPSYTRLFGVGYKSVLKLTDSAGPNANVITNDDWGGGNSHIEVGHLYCDWNRERLNTADAIDPGAPSADGVVFVNTEFAWVHHVKSVNAGKHNFDVSSPLYNSGGGDEFYEPGGSEYVWITECEAAGSGDDNFTTHFSNHVWFMDCVSRSPSAFLFGGDGNSNCYEADDGSKYITFTNCYAEGGARGFDIKGHSDRPAAQMVTLEGCTSVNAVIGINLRHDAHETGGQPYSTTAHHVNISNCKVVNPIQSGIHTGIYVVGFRVHAYRNVNVSNLQLIGGNDGVNPQNNANASVLEINNRARLINFSNISISGFQDALYDFRVLGGDINRTVNVLGISIYNSALTGIRVDNGINNVQVIGGVLNGTNEAGSIGIDSQDLGNVLMGIGANGYETPAQVGGTNYTYVPFMHPEGGLFAAPDGSVPNKYTSAVIASSDNSKITSGRSAVIGNRGGTITDEGSVLLASKHVIAPQPFTVTGGYGDTGTDSSANRKWELDSTDGSIHGTGQVSGGATFNDYAEYFESIDGAKIPTGTIVALEGDKIRAAQVGDEVLGVISETAGFVLGESRYCWQGRYLRNEFGGLIYEDQEVTDTDIDPDTGESVEVTRTLTLPVENPDYEDIGESYESRKERDEWHIVGLIGQVYVRVDDTVQAGDRINANNGGGTKGDHWRVMKITTPYDATKGYGVALCLVR